MNKTIVYTAILICGMALGYGLVNFFDKKDANKSAIEQNEPTIWTCSMHPEIKQEEPGLCPKCNMDLTPMTEDLGGADTNMFQLSERALALANVQTHTINVGNDNVGNKTFTGRIEATDAALKSQSAYVSGRVEQLYVNTTGTMVQQGQTLANIYSPELLSAQQELLSVWKRKDKNPSLYQAVHNKLLQWKWSEAQIQKLIETQEVQSAFPIRAMVSGEVVSKNISEGAYVTAGQELFEIADLQTVWGVIEVPESQANEIAIGNEVSLSTSAQREITGKIDFIHPLVDPSTRTVQIRIEIPNEEKKLKPGMLLHANINTTSTTNEEQIFIPKSAILWTGKRSIVYVAHKENGQTLFEMREVLLGNRNGDSYEVIQGVKPNEEIVTNGTFTIDAAAQLQGRESMMNREDNLAMQLSEENENKLLAFMGYYFELKDVFVSSSAESISEYADNQLDAIEELKITLDEKAQKLWKTVQQQWQHIAQEKQDVVKQRKAFKTLNDHLLPIAKMISSHKETWYVQECPMADNDTGGQWISLEDKIINPYFGDAMLHCGAVEQVW